jgi:hypothetical protein
MINPSNYITLQRLQSLETNLSYFRVAERSPFCLPSGLMSLGATSLLQLLPC